MIMMDRARVLFYVITRTSPPSPRICSSSSLLPTQAMLRRMPGLKEKIAVFM